VNTQKCETCSRPEKKPSLIGSLEAQRCNFSDMDGALKVTKGSMTVLKVERTMNLYKVIGSMVIGDTSVATEKEDTIRF